MNLLQIRTQARQRSDQENSEFVGDSELNGYINASYGELRDLLVSRFEDYYSSTIEFTLSGINTYEIPQTVYKIRGLDYQVNGSDWMTVYPFNFAERNSRNRATNRLIYGRRRLQYRLMGLNLILLPEDKASGNYKLWFIPRVTPLVDDEDEMSDVLDFEEYVVVDAAIKCLIKEESDITSLMAIKEQLRQRILAMSANRDAGMPERVADVSYFSNAPDFLFPE
jgi:hypothetical protein